MTAPDSLPLHALAEDNLAAASPDLLRAMVKTFADALMSAEADALCNAEYGQVSDGRVNHRNGYRLRGWDTRAGTVELAIPKLRSGSYFPHWLLERRRRAEQALISVVATAFLLGVSTRRVENLAESLGVTQLSKSQVSAMARHLEFWCWRIEDLNVDVAGWREKVLLLALDQDGTRTFARAVLDWPTFEDKHAGTGAVQARGSIRVLVDPGNRSGEVGVRATLVRFGECGGEGGHDPLTELDPVFSQVR